MFQSLHKNKQLQNNVDDHYSTKSILTLYFGYLLLWLFFWFAPPHFIIYETASFIFIPAGIRCTSLLMVPLRYWPVVWLAELTSAIVVLIFSSNNPPGIDGLFANLILPMLSYALPCYLFKRFVGILDFYSAKNVVMFFCVVFLSASSFAFVFNGFFQEISIFQQAFWIVFIAFAFGDIMGCLIVAPIVYYLTHKKSFSLTHFYLKSYFWIVALLASIFYVSVQFFALEYTKIALMFVALILTYKFKLGGAVVSILCCAATILLYSQSQFDDYSKIENQSFLVGISLISLIVAALTHESRALQDSLHAHNMQLNLQSHRLASSLAENRALTQKLISVQENERQHLAQELHDDIGQNMALMSIELGLLNANCNDTEKMENIRNLRSVVSDINSTTHRLMNTLHPRAIFELGLYDSLRYGDVAKMFSVANIDFVLDFNPPDIDVNKEQVLGLFRIIQESASNCVKHANATEFKVSFHSRQDHIEVVISDNGKGFTQGQTRSLGLIGIRERVAALNGEYELVSDTQGTRHKVILPA